MKNLIAFEKHITGLKEKKEWIAKAVKGGEDKLRNQLGLKKDEVLTKSRISQEISDLKSQDEDPSKPGAQLPPAKAKKYKRLNLAKTLMKLGENHSEMKNYMFFQNVINICSMCEDILKMDPVKIDSLLEEGHGWATDHVATSKDDVEEVFNFLRASMKSMELEHGEETETDENPEVIISDNNNC